MILELKGKLSFSVSRCYLVVRFLCAFSRYFDAAETLGFAKQFRVNRCRERMRTAHDLFYVLVNKFNQIMSLRMQFSSTPKVVLRVILFKVEFATTCSEISFAQVA